MSRFGELRLDDAAREATGNWKAWTCFVWFREPEIEDLENWSIAYTQHRDSGLLDQSNADVMARALKPFSTSDDPDVVFESHSHWAVGHVDGFSIRVYRDGVITDAFCTYHDLLARCAEYPILDEADYSQREHDATRATLADASWRLKRQYQLPDGWESEVYSWLFDNRPGGVANIDDRGGYPCEADLQEAFNTLGYKRLEDRQQGGDISTLWG
jgi:hypothetical protein